MIPFRFTLKNFKKHKLYFITRIAKVLTNEYLKEVLEQEKKRKKFKDISVLTMI
jgi:hypothetical protein